MDDVNTAEEKQEHMRHVLRSTRNGLQTTFPRSTRRHSLPEEGGDLSAIHRASAAVPAITPYAGRIGGIQDFVLDRSDPANAAELERVPDAAPLMSMSALLDLRGFRQHELWKAAVMEGVATFMIVYLTLWISIHPAVPPPLPPSPDSAAGVFATSAFLGPLIGGITSCILVTLFIYSFANVSGGHFNPMITIATFLARLTSLPRMVLYVASQTAGATLAGLMLRASYGSRQFDVGGCGINTSLVPHGEAFSIEFTCSLILLFIAFGVGLDPRQRQIFGPALAPALVGLALGVVSFGSAFQKPGYEGACESRRFYI